MQWKPKIVKEPAAHHRYGKDISRRGGYVYAAYSDDTLVAIGATVKEARQKYHKARDTARGVVRSADGLPPPNPRIVRWDERIKRG